MTTNFSKRPTFRRLLSTSLAAALLGSALTPATALEIKFKRPPQDEIDCLAQAIYFEARGEPENGQIAVAQVILNRVASGRFAPTICGVVFQGASRRNACQFSFACDGHPETMKEPAARLRANRLALEVTAGDASVTSVKKATHYHATYVTPSWAPKLTRVASIANHVFYRE